MRSSDFLFRLIKAMTKGDRRNFKLFARLQDGDKKYVKLFDAIDKQSEYDEPKLLEQFKGERFTRQFSVAKNYLYNYILKTLHIFHKDQYTELSTLMHQIQILMGKNLYDQARKLVRKAKHMAQKQERFQEILYLLEYERGIYHSTQNIKQYEGFLQTIREEERFAIDCLANLQKFNHLYDEIYVLRNRSTSARGAKEFEKVDEILANPLLENDENALSVRARLKMYDILNDCHMFKNDFASCLKYSRSIVEVYDSNPVIRKEKNIRYINSVSNLGVLYYYLGEKKAALGILNRLKQIETYNEHERLRVFEKYYHFKLGLCIEACAYEEGLATIESFENEFSQVEGKILKSIELGICYFAGYFYLQSGHPSESLTWINRILNEPKTELRLDLQCMARILNLVVHLELGNRDFVEYNLKSTVRFITNRGRMFDFERTTLKYIRQLANQSPGEDIGGILARFDNDIQDVLQNAREQKAVSLFDVPSWIKSQKMGIPMFELLRDPDRIFESR